MIWYSSYNHSDVPEPLLAIFSISIARIIFSNTRWAHFKEKYFRRGTCWASYVSMTRKSSPKWHNSALVNLFSSYSRWFLRTTQVRPAYICLAEVQSLKIPTFAFMPSYSKYIVLASNLYLPFIPTIPFQMDERFLKSNDFYLIMVGCKKKKKRETFSHFKPQHNHISTSKKHKLYIIRKSFRLAKKRNCSRQYTFFNNWQ